MRSGALSHPSDAHHAAQPAGKGLAGPARCTTPLTLAEAVAVFGRTAPPMTPVRWARLRPLLDAQAVAHSGDELDSRQNIASRS